MRVKEWALQQREDDLTEDERHILEFFSEVKHLSHVDKSKAITLALEIVGEIIGEDLLCQKITASRPSRPTMYQGRY